MSINEKQTRTYDETPHLAKLRNNLHNFTCWKFTLDFASSTKNDQFWKIILFKFLNYKLDIFYFFCVTKTFYFKSFSAKKWDGSKNLDFEDLNKNVLFRGFGHQIQMDKLAIVFSKLALNNQFRILFQIYFVADFFRYLFRFLRA